MAELQTVVNKIVSYESDPDLSQTNWFTTAGLTGDPSSSGYSCIWVNQFVKESLQHLGYTRVDTIWSGNFLTQMMATINQGETLFTYRGYLGMSGMADSHISTLTNGRKLPLRRGHDLRHGVVLRRTATPAARPSCARPTAAASAAVGTATIGHPHALQQLHLPGRHARRAEHRRVPRRARR